MSERASCCAARYIYSPQSDALLADFGLVARLEQAQVVLEERGIKSRIIVVCDLSGMTVEIVATITTSQGSKVQKKSLKSKESRKWGRSRSGHVADVGWKGGASSKKGQ